MSGGLEFETLAPGRELPPGLEEMTFPIYRPLLRLEPVSRHPEQGDIRAVQPVAVVVRSGDRLAGLALAEQPLDGISDRLGGGAGGDRRPELLSLFVKPAARCSGIATALLAALEREFAGRGATAMTTVYTAGRPSIPALERVLEKRGWDAPQARTLSVRFPPQAALASDLFSDRRMGALSGRLELFPWRDLDAESRARIRSTHEAAPWITPALAPWRFEGADVDPLSSIGARYRGEVVGWVINHVVAPGTVRFTCSFLRKDLSRRGRIVPLYRESLRRLAEGGVERATFVTPVNYPNMVRFILRWIAPIAEFVGETRGSSKRLGRPAPGAELLPGRFA
ncbi:MAG: GNAT family N-acetyltransferase [Thermoanaerobaculia bacterium]